MNDRRNNRSSEYAWSSPASFCWRLPEDSILMTKWSTSLHSGQIVHQLARNMQRLLGSIVGYRASIGEDEPPPLGLADSRHDLVVKFGLATVSNWATFPQSTHQAFVGESQSLAEGGAGETVAPTHH